MNEGYVCEKILYGITYLCTYVRLCGLLDYICILGFNYELEQKRNRQRK